MNLIFTLFCASLMFPYWLFGTVTESSHFKDILSHIEGKEPGKVLVVCDIDNTLIQAAQQLGSVACGEHIVHSLMEKGASKSQAEGVELILWDILQPQIDIKPVDPNMLQVMEELKARGITVIGLTARHPGQIESTLHQLHLVGLDLSKHPHVPASDISLEVFPTSKYQRGVIFGTTFHKKSDLLFRFLEKTSLNPETVIFVDDKLGHVIDMERSCHHRGVECIAIRFSGADEQMKRFDPAIAEIQWKALPHKIGDEEALQLLSGIEIRS
jgi:hypothetical protein